MLRILLIVAVLFTSASTTSHNTSKKNDSSNLTKHYGNNDSLQTVYFVNNEAPSPDKATTQTEPPHWYTSPEWWLCILGVPTLFVVGWQAKETRKAADAAKKGAEAALLNAKAVMNAERAWVVVSAVEGHPAASKTDLANVRVHVTLCNVGNSPAFLMDGASKSKTLPPGTTLPEVPDLFTESEAAQNLEKTDGIALQPRGEYKIRNIEGGVVVSKPDLLYTGQQVLWIYGCVRFCDVFGRRQETWYCYRWEPHTGTQYRAEWVVDGPKAYHRVTYQYEKTDSGNEPN